MQHGTAPLLIPVNADECRRCLADEHGIKFNGGGYSDTISCTSFDFPRHFYANESGREGVLGKERNNSDQVYHHLEAALCVSLTSSSTVETPKAFKHQRQRRGICSQAWVYPFSSMVRLDLPIVLNWNRGERKSLMDLE